MGKLRWYKRDPDAALGGMMALTLEERGAYGTVLDLIYSHADQLPDDDRFIAGWCGCDLRVWRRIKKRLVELGKLQLEGGCIRNIRATSGVDEALSRVEQASDAAETRWAKSKAETNKNKDMSDAKVEDQQMQSTTTTTSRKNTPHSPPQGGRVAKRFQGKTHEPGDLPIDPWDARVRSYRADIEAGKQRPFWQVQQWGAPPGSAGCHAPPSILERYGFDRRAA